ncbi:hypothetical protein, partial [Escherichia coli]
WSDIFVKKAEMNPLEKRYGISGSDDSYRWNEVDKRFSAYFHERRSLNNFHRDRVITFEQIAE